MTTSCLSLDDVLLFDFVSKIETRTGIKLKSVGVSDAGDNCFLVFREAESDKPIYFPIEKDELINTSVDLFDTVANSRFWDTHKAEKA